MVQRATKKPITVEFVKFDATKESFDSILSMGDVRWNPGEMGSESFFIETSEGDMKVSKGDYVIKEPFDKDRGFYPCKPDIFNKTYEIEQMEKEI